MKDFLKIYGRYKKQEPEEDKLDEGSVIIGKFRNNRMFQGWLILYIVVFFISIICLMPYLQRSGEISSNLFEQKIKYFDNRRIERRKVNIVNEYAWIPIIVISTNIGYIAFLFILYHSKTKVIFDLKDGKASFQIKGLFFNTHINESFKYNAYQYIARYKLSVYYYLVLEICCDRKIYTLAEKMETSFNTGLPLKFKNSLSMKDFLQLTTTQEDGYVTDIVRKLGLIKY